MPNINFSKLTNLMQNLAGFIPKKGIEKIIFKALLGIWALVIIAVIILRLIYYGYNDVESRIKEAATSVKPPAANPSEIAMYKSLLDTVKHPKSIGEYTHEIRQDPFSEYREMLPVAFGAERDFVLKSVDRMPLPLIYKGYIELPDRIIGQVDLEGATRFVKAGSTLNGYRILSVSRKKIEMTDASGKKLDFLLHRPVAGDELTAVLYDTLSKRTFTVYVFTEIGDYKVVDITPEYVILQYRDKEKKICF